MIWIVVVSCWVVSFLFAGTEAALLALQPARLRHRAKSGDHRARRLEKMLRHPERLLITVLLVTNAADIVALLLITLQLRQRFGLAGYGLTMVICLPVYLFLLGVLPKSLFRRFPLRTAIRLAAVLEFATRVLSPLLVVGEWIARNIVSRGKTPPRLFAAREELKLITMQSERGGALTADERAIIHNVVDFGSVTVRSVMVPLQETIALRPDESTDDVLQISEHKNIDRFPVVENGRPIGLINVFDILVDGAPVRALRTYMRRIIIASEDESAYRVIRRLRAARVGLAAVLDARRNFIGIVALEDLLRQLVRG